MGKNCSFFQTKLPIWIGDRHATFSNFLSGIGWEIHFLGPFDASIDAQFAINELMRMETIYYSQPVEQEDPDPENSQF